MLPAFFLFFSDRKGANLFVAFGMTSLEIISTYPIWYSLFCVAVAGGLTWLLYALPLFGDEDKLWLRRLLGTLRFCFLFVLTFLLLEPLVKRNEKEIEKPMLAVAIDNSSSMRLTADSAGLAAGVNKVMETIEDRLGEDHEIHYFLAGDGAREGREIAFNEEVSNLSKTLKNIDDRFENQNLGALILLSDGIYNQGVNPVYYKRRSGAPVYALAMGDTLPHRDLVLEEVRHNRIAYLGNQFPLVAVLNARDLAGKRSKLVVRESGKVVYEKAIEINAFQWNLQEEIRLKAEKSGMVRYDISLEPVGGEHNLLNNRKTIYLEVIDARNKVLLLANSPHPDVAALAASIRSNEHYEVKTEYAFSMTEPKWEEINLLILHQLPSLRYPITPLLEKAQARNIPVFFVCGEQTHYPELRRWSQGLSVQSSQLNSNEAIPVVNPGFSLFQLSEPTLAALKRLPPLYSPFGSYGASNPMRVLLHQKIGSIESGDPLLAFSDGEEQKTGVLFGEGFWRWRIYDFEKNGNHEAVDELLSRVVQFLSAKKDMRPFRAFPLKPRFNENEHVQFQAELYNETFQLINDAGVSLRIISDAGKEYTYRFGRNQGGYSLDAGFLTPGDYRYVASVIHNGKKLESAGLFSVSPLQLEALNTRADFHLLYQLAEKSGGSGFLLSQAEALCDSIAANKRIHSVSYTTTTLKDLINLKLIFWILVAFISCEWFIRKFKGGY